MKKLLLLLCLFTVGTQLIQTQKVDSASEASNRKLFDYYWQKHEKTVKTGRVLLGIGGVAIAGGIYLIDQGLRDYPTVDISPELTIFAGTCAVVATVASIPFLISAGNNRRKARLALKGETIGFRNMSLPNCRYGALSVTLPF